MLSVRGRRGRAKRKEKGKLWVRFCHDLFEEIYFSLLSLCESAGQMEF